MTALPSLEHAGWLKSLDERHRASLLRYAYSLCRDAAMAEDAVQESFVRLMRQLPETIRGHEGAWLFRVCRSRVIDAQRRNQRVIAVDFTEMPPESDPDTPDPRQRAESSEAERFLWQAVGELSPAQQEVLRLKYQAQLSYREIADVTGKTVNAVGVHLHSALKNLRTRLAAHPEW